MLIQTHNIIRGQKKAPWGWIDTEGECVNCSYVSLLWLFLQPAGSFHSSLVRWLQISS